MVRFGLRAKWNAFVCFYIGTTRDSMISTTLHLHMWRWLSERRGRKGGRQTAGNVGLTRVLAYTEFREVTEGWHLKRSTRSWRYLGMVWWTIDDTSHSSSSAATSK
ncbi:hypothetical protein JAAARDRAFT_346561 [Jaapia argillacea MUCL 33604]|uniref:Uncharacterized protein n=1 Tax=Jaapia argillacea MUCL 33604 TaxID=933084 RepID=A0A067PY69_9AGAM|nr:hypothetical protein JAAARDRAFT_346561 [Jaapia argillacea MUCL 33604]